MLGEIFIFGNKYLIVAIIETLFEQKCKVSVQIVSRVKTSNVFLNNVHVVSCYNERPSVHRKLPDHYLFKKIAT